VFEITKMNSILINLMRRSWAEGLVRRRRCIGIGDEASVSVHFEALECGGAVVVVFLPIFK